MGTEKMFAYFTSGIAMVVALYEICRTGKKRINRNPKL